MKEILEEVVCVVDVRLVNCIKDGCLCVFIFFFQAEDGIRDSDM